MLRRLLSIFTTRRYRDDRWRIDQGWIGGGEGEIWIFGNLCRETCERRLYFQRGDRTFSSSSSWSSSKKYGLCVHVFARKDVSKFRIIFVARTCSSVAIYLMWYNWKEIYFIIISLAMYSVIEQTTSSIYSSIRYVDYILVYERMQIFSFSL